MVFEAAQIDWNSNVGRLLDLLTFALPREPRFEINVFGSAPLQLFVDGMFLSEDIDLFTNDETSSNLARFVEDHGWGKGQTNQYIEVCDSLAFRSTSDWRVRAVEVERHGHVLRFVHPWDVLVSKLQRLEKKDLDAFRLVIDRTGHPTESEFRYHLQKAVDLYRPRFDEESERGDMMLNTQLLWREIWGREIEPRAEIIRPAVARANLSYSDFDPTLKTKLAKVKVPD